MRNIFRLMFCLALLSSAVPLAFSRGDKIIPQVVSGAGWSTKFDLTNVSPNRAITNMRLVFYLNNGAPWAVQTNRGTGAIQLSLQPRQTIRVETTGGLAGAGYAVIYDEEEENSRYSQDYALGISVFYVFSGASGVVDTVTVPVAQPTAAAVLPVEMNDSQKTYSGLAIANWAGYTNTITLNLYPDNWNPSMQPRTVTFQLQEREQRAEFLDENLFPGLTSFKGMAEITAVGPVALLGLLQTAAVGGQQYATLIPVDKEALRRNSHMVLLQVIDDDNPYTPLDIDGFTSDYFRIIGVAGDTTESYSWDLEYRYEAPDGNVRFFRPVNNAEMAYLGIQNSDNFDAISLPDLKALSYSYDDFDLSGSNLQVNATFAVHTDVGNYAKIRIVQIVDTTYGSRLNKDLVLEVYIYK